MGVVLLLVVEIERGGSKVERDSYALCLHKPVSCDVDPRSTGDRPAVREQLLYAGGRKREDAVFRDGKLRQHSGLVSSIEDAA
jgi:hypothetical protein